MGNSRSKNPFLRILNKWDKNNDDEALYKNFAEGDVKVHCFEGEYYVEGERCTLGPMTKRQLKDLGREGRMKISLESDPGGAGGDGDEENGKEIKTMKYLNENDKTSTKNLYNTETENSCKDNVVVKLTTSDKDPKISTSEKYLPSEVNESDKERLNNISPKTKAIKSSRFLHRQFRKTFLSLRYPCNVSLKKYKDFKIKQIKTDIQGEKIKVRSLNKKKSLLIQNIFKNKFKFIETKEIKKPKSNIKIKTFNLSSSKNKNKRKTKVPFEFEDINKINTKAMEALEETTFTFNNNITSPITKAKSLGFTQPLNKEKIRYTAYANVESINWSKQKALIRRMSSGFVQRFGCNVQLGDEPIKYRGGVFYTVNIDGKDHISVLKCRNCLPTQLRSVLIQPQNNGEESSTILCRKYIYSPYNPELIKDYGTHSLKLSY